MGRLGEGNHSADFNQRRQFVSRKIHYTIATWPCRNGSSLIPPLLSLELKATFITSWLNVIREVRLRYLTANTYLCTLRGNRNLHVFTHNQNTINQPRQVCFFGFTLEPQGKRWEQIRKDNRYQFSIVQAACVYHLRWTRSCLEAYKIRKPLWELIHSESYIPK